MVVVPKKSVQSAFAWTFDRELVLREVHPLPKVDETLAQMAGVTLFSNDVVEAHATALN